MRRLFTFEGRVDRATYLKTGFALMALKVAVDVAIWRAATGRWAFPPFALDLSETLSARSLTNAAAWASAAMLAWSAVFLWIGVAMTARRATDAGVGAGWAALFVVPFVNYALMLAMCALPTRERRATAGDRAPDAPVHAFVAGAIATVVAVGLIALSVFVLRGYGAALFVGTPVVFGAVCAYVANRRGRRTLGNTLWIVYATLLVVAALLVLVAMEGAVCILMATPIAFLFATMGALLGYAAAACPRTSGTGPVALLLPAFVALDALAPPPTPHEVASSVDIDAPPTVVWNHVVGFAEIPDPPEGLFRVGLACPVRATIDGRGVGAVRRCEFTTGAFLEPITTWDEPRRLAFDVAEQPPPMVEMSPYSTVHAPHLDGYFRSVRGEFRLVALPGGRTRLEGSTWYLLDIHPRAYWDLWADGLVHRIHLRVLRHVKRLAESER